MLVSIVAAIVALVESALSKENIILVGPVDRDIPRLGQYAAPPLGVHRIAAYARKVTGADVSILDPCLIGVEECLRILSDYSPSLVGFSTLAPTMEDDLSLLTATKTLLPNALIVAGGQGVAGLERILVEQGGVDVVVRGFGEDALVSLAALVGGGRRATLCNSRLTDIPNLTISDQNGKSFTTRPAAASVATFHASIEALDFSAIPYPSYWEMNQRRYSPAHVRVMKNEGLVNTVRLMTQSHCPLGCNYCSSTRFLDVLDEKRQKVFMQSPMSIIATIERALTAHPKTTAFFINDDDFVLQRSRAVAFAEIARHRFSNRQLSFIAMTRIDHVDKEMARIMASAGFRLIFLGVETFSSHTLAAMEKHLHDCGNYTSKAREAVVTLLDAGIVPQIGLIPFYPSVSEQDLVITIENAIDMVARGARLSVFPMTEAYPGASLFKTNTPMTSKEIHIGKTTITLPVHFLPHDPSMRDLAAKSIEQHDQLRRTRKMSAMPQPVDGIYFLRAVLRNLDRDTSAADRVLRDLEHNNQSNSASALQYLNA